MIYCPRCYTTKNVHGKYCNKCKKQIQREINDCYRNYGWPNGSKLKWRQATNDSK